RLYVDSLLPVQPMTDAEKAMIDKWYKAKVQQLDQVFQETAKIISKLTRNVSLVLAPQISKAAFRCMQFLPLDDHRVIAVLMTDAGFVENRIMEMPAGSSFEDFQRMAKVINGCLAGHTLGAIQNGSLKQIEAEIGDNGLYESAMTLIDKALNSQRKERLYLGGTTEMMEQPEFHNVDKVKELLIMLEKDQLMKDILKAHLGDGLTVTIGQENEYSGIKDCSIITATYHLDGELLGSMAVLGPTRMEYGRTMSLLNYMNNNLTEVIKRLHW
ncbi:MAG: heat-inducible transcription repressor HrcA, partial [Selenomonadaceae bacterium]|nr:heat-inducible transcription repressor HrcA [Selenomonadaceae bacterium]